MSACFYEMCVVFALYFAAEGEAGNDGMKPAIACRLTRTQPQPFMVAFIDVCAELERFTAICGFVACPSARSPLPQEPAHAQRDSCSSYHTHRRRHAQRIVSRLPCTPTPP